MPQYLLVVHLAVAEGPVPIRRAHVGFFVRGERARTGGGETQTRRRHQAFLRTGHRDIDAPGVHLERHAAERGDGVDHQQRIVAGGAHRLADRLDVVDDARGGVDLRHQDRLDLALGVGLEPRLDRFRPHRAAEIAAQNLDLGAEHLGGLAPADGEAAAFQHQHLVAARQHIGQRRFPGAVAVGGIDVDFAGGGKDASRSASRLVGQRDQRPGINIDRRPLHRLQHGIGHDGRTRNGKEFAAVGN